MTRSSAAFFDLDKTLISRSSTLAFSRPFYRDGLISRAALIRGTFAQAVFQRAGAGPGRLERIRVRSWPAMPRLAGGKGTGDRQREFP